eukprot:TRINITY_DN9950_c0_g1_i2.p1 TRINITY_DN9950_c0_g1~~TRINITY_DN9950_c0_g1_i2.p1  ORF type:complete len:233 (+),score=24.69 TRINITY_DN9950_c0_g1_i2:52-699(+)
MAQSSDSAGSTAALPGADSAELEKAAVTCAVCFEEEPHVRMPCCGREGSSIGYCRRCIEIICEQAEGTGACPCCRHHITIGAAGVVSKAVNRAKCWMCRQMRVIVRRGVCDACLLGRRFPLRYQCKRCNGTSVISHPMWRYQASPSEFGKVTWACQRCHDYTHWRVVPECLSQVPDFDCPEGWGRRDDWLASVRRQRQEELSGGAHQAAGCCSVM